MYYMIRALAIYFFLLSPLGLVAQSLHIEDAEALIKMTTKYELSEAQKTQVKQLLIKRRLELNAVAINPDLDEPQRAIKRSSIDIGFEGSIDLMLNDEQRLNLQSNTIKNRKERIAIIERLKKKGYTQTEILKQLDNK